MEHGLHCELVTKQVNDLAQTVTKLVHDEAIVQLAHLLVHFALALVFYLFIFTIIVLLFFLIFWIFDDELRVKTDSLLLTFLELVVATHENPLSH